jgi:hypothetical protein
MMHPDWAGLAGNSISAALGGCLTLLGVHLTNRSSAKARHTEMIRSRGEELYALATGFQKGLTSYFLRRVSVASGAITYDKMLDLEIEDLKRNPQDVHRLEMLVDIYFPEARAACDRLMEARNALRQIAAKHKSAYLTDRNTRHFQAPLSEAMDSIEAAGKQFCEIVLGALRQL